MAQRSRASDIGHVLFMSDQATIGLNPNGVYKRPSV